MKQQRHYAQRVADQDKKERRRERAAKSTGAHTTDPIMDNQTVREWMKAAREHDANRSRAGVSWYLLLLLGFNSGLRIGDICRLKVGDVRGRERIQVIAEKTGKLSNVKLQADTQKKIAQLLEGRDENEYILQSRQRGKKTGEPKPISRQRAYAIIREIARRTDFNRHAGCHTMRKTFAYEMYRTTGDLSMVQKVLNHSSQMETLRYIGLDQMAVDEAIEKMHQMI